MVRYNGLVWSDIAVTFFYHPIHMILGCVSNWPPFLWLFKKPSIRLATVVNLTETHKAAYFQLINFAVKQVLVSRDPGLEKLLSDSIE